MHALLLIAHGSRREASNAEVRELAARLERLAGKRYWRWTSPTLVRNSKLHRQQADRRPACIRQV